MEKEYEEAKTSKSIEKKIDRMKNKSIRRDILAYINLIIGRGE
jgi:predicted type IV restriction endonuclease